MDYCKNLDLQDIIYFCDFDLVWKIEQWKDVVGYETLYSVSDLGRLKSIRIGPNRKEKILRPGTNPDGYKTVVLYHLDYKKQFKLHRLVANSFLDNPFNLEMVNHKDEIKSNNYYKNLEWVTRRENGVHRYKNKNTTSKYCGVSWSKQAKKWVAMIRFNNETVYLGTYHDELDAYAARVKFEKDNGIINRYL